MGRSVRWRVPSSSAICCRIFTPATARTPAEQGKRMRPHRGIVHSGPRGRGARTGCAPTRRRGARTEGLGVPHDFFPKRRLGEKRLLSPPFKAQTFPLINRCGTKLGTPSHNTAPQWEGLCAGGALPLAPSDAGFSPGHQPTHRPSRESDCVPPEVLSALGLPLRVCGRSPREVAQGRSPMTVPMTVPSPAGAGVRGGTTPTLMVLSYKRALGEKR